MVQAVVGMHCRSMNTVIDHQAMIGVLWGEEQASGMVRKGVFASVVRVMLDSACLLNRYLGTDDRPVNLITSRNDTRAV